VDNQLIRYDLPVKPTPLPANLNHEPHVSGIAMAKRSDLMIPRAGHGPSLTGPCTGTSALALPNFKLAGISVLALAQDFPCQKAG